MILLLEIEKQLQNILENLGLSSEFSAFLINSITTFGFFISFTFSFSVMWVVWHV